mgnify:CR=1 FL=1
MEFRKLISVLAVLLVLALPAQAAQVKFKNVSVHDPSILCAEDGRYYIYGSHMQAAWSDDLVDWKMFSKLEKCNLQPDYAVEFKEALTFARTGTFWAPDVIQLADGRYYMYYCCCEGSSPLSALGVAVSDSPEGPFENVQILLKSGYEGYDATQYPNAIDPCVFFDAEDRLWMVYGSYSGGLFLLELDPETGLVKEGQETYGIHLLGGNHACIEGPYMVYNAETGYYYLFLSFGGLGVNDGYNMRVCRSKNVEGPYEDAAGNAMLDCKCDAWSFWDNDDIAPYGTKIMGGCQFTPLEGENSPKASAIRSPGHNSVYFDPQTGRWFLIHHTRFAATGDRYIVQTRELWFNDAGWPVVAPTRYVRDDQLPDGLEFTPTGTWKVLNHEQDVNTVEHTSVAVEFGGDGAVSGGYTGEYNVDGERFSVTLDGVSYSGVCSVGYDADQDAFVSTFTAMSPEGQALWGIRATGQD